MTDKILIDSAVIEREIITSNCPKCGRKVVGRIGKGIAWCCPVCVIEWPVEELTEQPVCQEPEACGCGANPWHDCDESEGCRIKKKLCGGLNE